MKRKILLIIGIFFVIVTIVCITRFSNFSYSSHSSGIIEEEDGENKLQNFLEALLQETEKTKDPRTGLVPRERLLTAQKQMARYFIANRAAPGIQWQERGPNDVGGRTRALIFDRNDATNSTVFAGGVAGGLWKNTNISGNGSWTRIPGVLENMAISCLVQDLALGSHNTMYFGTGEIWGNADGLRGLGIFKSTDGGATWQQLPSTNNSLFYYTQKIIINGNHDVLAATGSGIYKSTDGGISWTNILSYNTCDLELAANGDIYAATFNGLVFKTTNNGTSWSNVSPSGSFGRIEIATAPSNASVLYLLCKSSASSDVSDIFQSTDGGNNWISRPVPTIIDQGANSIFTRGQAWYDLIAAVDPNNANTVFIGGVDALKSIDGGGNWQQVSVWSFANSPGFVNPAQFIHADQHAIVFAPGSSSVGIWGTDGGVFYSSNLNVASPTKPTWGARNNGYNVTQFYAGAMHPAAGNNYLLAGAQDNGSRSLNASGISSSSYASGGDGAFCHIDQTNGQLQVTSYVRNNYYRSTDGGLSFPSVYSNGSRGSFINPTDFDSNTDFLYADGRNGSTGGIYFRINMNSTLPDATAVTSTAAYVTVTNFGTAGITHVKISPVTSNRVYFGMLNGTVGYVDNASTPVDGSSTTGTLIKSSGTGSVSGIDVDPANENHIIITYSNYGVQSVFESTNALAATPTWTNIENNLPDMPVRWVIFYPGNTDRALLATELGVWSTDDLNGASTEWTPTNLGLANTRVDMLKVRTSDNTILAATHGRGLFTTTITNTNLPTVQLQQSKIDVTENYTTATGCGRGYKDVVVNATISAVPAGDVIVTIAPDPSATAILNADYQILANQVTFTSTAGSATTLPVTIRIFDDAMKESKEYVPLTYTITSGTSFAQKGTTMQSCQIDISDNDYLNTIITNSYIANIVSGTTSSNNGGVSTPLEGSQTDKRIQYIYLASELIQNGLKPGIINALSFFVSDKQSTAPYNGFTIKIGTTTRTNLNTGFPALSNLTTVYSAPAGGYNSVAGDNSFTGFSFNWDGTSNIVLDFCFDNASTGSDDVVACESMSYYSLAYKKSTTATDIGCNFSAAFLGSNRPVITFTESVPVTPVETVLNSTSSVYLGPYETIHFFDGSNKILSTIQNLSSHDYGCTSVTIDRAGTGSSQFWNTPVANNMMNKTIRIIPTANDPSGLYTITTYYSQAEVQGWQAATGNTFSNIQMVKYSGAISDITPTNSQASNVTVISSPVRGTLGTDYTLTATFNNGFSGFGAGVPGIASSTLPVTYLKFAAKLANNHAVTEWQTSTEVGNHGFEVEKSTDGVNFHKIGFVPAVATFSYHTNYSFTDPEIAGTVQYYRLKQIDLSGTSHYSAIVTVRSNGSLVAWVNNPFANEITIQLSSSDSPINVQLLDVNGKLLLKKNVAAGSANKLSLDVSSLHLAQGVYTLIVNEGQTRSVFKLVHIK